MKTKHHTLRSIKDSTFAVPPDADPKRVGLIAAGNPDVLSEAKGQESYAKRGGGRVKISGAYARHRLDRQYRRSARR
jgi:hypothetical protein